jgi:hypothetical protein
VSVGHIALLEGLAIASGPAGVVLVHWYREARQRIHRKLARVPRVPIAELRESTPVRITGVVKPLASWVASPIHNRGCVFYRATIEVRYTRWVAHADEQHGVPFVIEDETGYAIVEPLAAELVTNDHRFLPAFNPDPVLDTFLLRHGIHSKDNVRVCERRIDVGTRITVIGTAQRERDPLAPPQEGYRAEHATCWRFASSKRYPLVVSDAFEG